MPLSAHTGYTKTDKHGAMAVAIGAGLWGLFWIPLRYFDDAGIRGLWAVALVMAIASLPACIVCIRQSEIQSMQRRDAWLIGCALGFSTVLYFLGMIYSDVIRVIFLFYMLPVWTLLSARVIYGEPITPPRIAMVVVTLTGLWLLLGGGTSLPWPKNIGDWCAIGAGACWGISLSALRGVKELPPFASTCTTVLSAMLLATLAAIATSFLNLDMPVAQTTHLLSEDWLKVSLAAILFGVAALYPAVLGQVWGARRIPAPTAALLTMTEIIVATASAMFLIGSELTAIAWLGGILIVLAMCANLAYERLLIR